MSKKNNNIDKNNFSGKETMKEKQANNLQNENLNKSQLSQEDNSGASMQSELSPFEQVVSNDFIAIKNLEHFYKSFLEKGDAKASALIMQLVNSWFSQNIEFDPLSYEAMQTDLDTLLKRSLKNYNNLDLSYDYISQIVDFVDEETANIIRAFHEKILREHKMMPSYLAREIDINSMMWLSKQNGRTVKEKLAVKPNLLAVKRRQSVDTTENTLFKAFSEKLELAIDDREKAFREVNIKENEMTNNYLYLLSKSKYTDEYREIGEWKNLPPNNTLLQDRRYRKIWQGWLRIQSLNEIIAKNSKDYTSGEFRAFLNFVLCALITKLNKYDFIHFVQQPVRFNYDNEELEIIGESDSQKDIYAYYYSDEQNNEDNCSEIKFSLNLMRSKITQELKWMLKVFKDEKNIVIFTIVDNKLSLRLVETSTTQKFDISVNGILGFISHLENIILTSLGKTVKNDVKSVKELDSFPYAKYACLDINNLYPKVMIEGKEYTIPERLLAQNWDGYDEIIDCSNSKAVYVSQGKHHIDTASIHSIFNQENLQFDKSSGIISKFALLFAEKLKKYINTDVLTYVYPDNVNDFELKEIRQNINLKFAKNLPLPRSISLFYAHMFEQNKNLSFKSNDIVFVLDTNANNMFITPLKIIIDPKLKNLSPITKGITLERYPSIELNVACNLRKFFKDDLKFSEDISQALSELYSLNDFKDDNTNFTIIEDNSDNFARIGIDKSLISLLKSKVKATFKATQKLLDEAISKFKYNEKNSHLYLLPISDSLWDKKLEKVTPLTNPNSTMSGLALFYDLLNNKKLQEQKILLWKDHLPNLAIAGVRDVNNLPTRFDLVKDISIAPIYMQSEEIEIKKSFTLPANQKEYSFKLVQNDGGVNLRFKAFLRSPDFPAEENIECRLKMTYTYGADDTYKLVFIPLDSKKYRPINVIWQESGKEEFDYNTLKYPIFPKMKDIEYFNKNEGKYGSIISRHNKKVNINFELLSRSSFSRAVIPNVDSKEWKISKQNPNLPFCFVETEDGVKAYTNRYNVEKDLHGGKSSKKICCLYCLKEDSKDERKQNYTLYGFESFKSKLMFSRILSILLFDKGRSYKSAECEKYGITKVVDERINLIKKILKNNDLKVHFEEELYLNLAYLHKDAPNELVDYINVVIDRLNKNKKNKEELTKILKKVNRIIPFAIGTIETKWQKKALNALLSILDSEQNEDNVPNELLFMILAVFRRSEKPIELLTAEQVLKLSCSINRELKTEVQNIKNNNMEIKSYRKNLNGKFVEVKENKTIHHLSDLLETLFLLFISRKNPDINVKKVLAPEEKITNELLQTTNDIINLILNKTIPKLKFKTEIKENAVSSLTEVPAILNAINMFLTNDDGAASITISDIGNEESSD